MDMLYQRIERILPGSVARLAMALLGAVAGAWGMVVAMVVAHHVWRKAGTDAFDMAEVVIAKVVVSVFLLPLLLVPVTGLAFAGHLAMVLSDRRGCAAYALCGGGMGACLAIVFDGRAGGLAGIAVPGMAGLGAALAFWLVARPDRNPSS
jgi:hypothetical protein